ncbi:MAG: hypothetical protein AAGC60_00020 [Acidobacteriota bacterium]
MNTSPVGERPGAPLPSAVACLRAGLAVCLRRPLVAFGGLPVLVLAIVVGCLVPLFNFAFLLLGLAPLVGSLPVVALALVDGERIRAATLLGGFRRYERSLALFWVGYLMLIVSALPLLVALWVDRHVTPPSWQPLVLGAAVAVAVILAAVLLHRYALAFFVAVDVPRGRPVSEVLERAAMWIDIERRAILVRLGIFAAVGLLGGALFGVGLLLTLPVALTATAVLYRALEPGPLAVEETETGAAGVSSTLAPSQRASS